MPMSFSFQPPLLIPGVAQVMQNQSISLMAVPTAMMIKIEEPESTVGILYDKTSLKAHEVEISALKKGMEEVKGLNTKMQEIKDTLVNMPRQIVIVLANQMSIGSKTDASSAIRGKQGQPMIGTSVQYSHFFCGEEGHQVRDYVYQKEMINKGWIIWNMQINRYMLRDGSQFPSVLPAEKLKDKVAEYAKSKGWNHTAHPEAYLFMNPEEETIPVYQMTSVPLDMGFDWNKFAEIVAEKVQMPSVESKN
uniref:Uncharacterized protein n=1 Tax=Moniliophthora roreri TaxID=221103 RepID=A0A0W0FAV3_MONRR